jgi:diguanylate cyclase (GGDEF)-like protein
VGQAERLSWISEAPLWADALQHVLVVAEQPGPRQELMQLCMGEGYQATPVATPEMLLAQPKTNVDLILMVLEGHGRSLDLCGEVRTMEAFRSASIMLIAPTPSEPEQAAAALLAGADDYCSFDQRFRCELRARIRVHLRNKRMRDAIERLRGERNNLRSRAAVDSLTGALARRALFESVEKALNAGQPFAVLFADIDFFKKVNDTFGHGIGDLALQRVAETLSKERRQGDVCGRYGGEEFVLVVSQVSAHEAQRVAERHRRAVAGLRLAAQGGPERITISIGVAVFDPVSPDPTVTALLSRADAALYRAKNAGRDCVQMAEPFVTPEENADEKAMRQWLRENIP